MSSNGNYVRTELCRVTYVRIVMYMMLKIRTYIVVRRMVAHSQILLLDTRISFNVFLLSMYILFTHYLATYQSVIQHLVRVSWQISINLSFSSCCIYHFSVQNNFWNLGCQDMIEFAWTWSCLDIMLKWWCLNQ